MKTISLIGHERPVVGSRNAKDLRNEGKVPCVIYGGKTNVHFWAYVQDFGPIVYTPETYRVQINVGGTVYDTVIKELQFHPVSERMDHIDFVELKTDSPVIVNLPVQLTGTAEGVRKGGKMITNLKRMKVRGMLNDIPSSVLVPVDALDLGKSIRVREVSVDKLDILNDPSLPVATVGVPRGLKTA